MRDYRPSFDLLAFGALGLLAFVVIVVVRCLAGR